MGETDRLRAENETLRARLSGLSEAILRISENLDLDTVLQQVVENARSLTDARYGAITTIDESGGPLDFITSGLTPEEKQELLKLPDGPALFQYLSALREPLRIRDLADLTREAGFSENPLPIRAFMSTQIRDRGRHVGNIHIGEKEAGQEFTPEDEETLAMFASQAAMAITNARRYGEEQRAKGDLEALVNTSPVGVVVYDARTREVMKVNQEARRIVGGMRGRRGAFGELLEAITYRRMDGREIPPGELPLERAISSGETVRAEEIVIGLPDGDAVTTLVNATPIYSEDGEIVSVVVTNQDITPLEELERLRAEFLGVVSHELRAPLTSIKGSAATVLRSPSPLDPVEARQFFRIIDEQADQMRDLINDLLDLTRIETGHLSVAPEPADVPAVIDQARNAFLSSGAGNVIEVEPLPVLPRIGADRQRVVQVLYNLFSNASKSSPEASTIRVAARHQDYLVAVSVTDEGIGVPPEDLPRLFSKFSRIDHEEGRWPVGGHGLGLAISKGIVEAHGGRIWAESDGPGHGARFTFTIPVADEAADSEARSPAPPAAAPGPPPAERERILAVDDNPQILRYIRKTLSEAGYATIVTVDPEEVVHLLEAERPHLLLLNLVLPGTDGFELMQRIAGVFDAPVIFLSGRGRDQDIVRAFEMGAADYMLKPFSPTELVARIRAALRKRELSRRPEPYVLGDLIIDHVERRVTVAGRPVELTTTEYMLLYELAREAGRALTHDQLFQRIWRQHGLDGNSSLLRTLMRTLRQKLGDDARNPAYLFTVSGVGYRLANPGPAARTVPPS